MRSPVIFQENTICFILTIDVPSNVERVKIQLTRPSIAKEKRTARRYYTDLQSMAEIGPCVLGISNPKVNFVYGDHKSA